jgi:cytoskeletal protein CcmA (bactofilin family)
MGTSDETQRSLSTAAALSSPGSTVRTPAFLGASLRIKGQVTGEEDLRVDGKIEGPISLPDYRLTVGPAAEVKGPVVAREIVVYGNVQGNLRGRERVEIKKDGSVVGELTTARIMVEDGAYIKGNVEIERGVTAAPTDPNTLLALAEKDFKMKSIRAADSRQEDNAPGLSSR